MEIFLRKNVIENNNLSDDGLAVYVALRKLMNKEEKEYYISCNMIAYILYGNINVPRRFTDHIKNGLKNLIDMKLIRTINLVQQSM